MEGELRVLEVPGGPEVARVFGDLAEIVDGSARAALLPVPADDPVRSGILTEALQPGEPIDPRCALVAATSGSTGTPKGAMLTGENLAASARATDDALGGPGRWLLALPAHHIAGIQVILRSLRFGAEPLVVDVRTGFDPLDLPRALDSAGAGGPSSGRLYTSLVPGQLQATVTHSDPAVLRALSRFDAVLVGGAAVAPAALARAREAGARVVRTYGMSETAGGCVYDGRPLGGVEVEIDADGRVWLGGPQVALGYRGRPGDPAFAKPGWLRTDDAGELDSGGRLRILGRLDDVAVVGGLKVRPQVVENALRSHPSVGDAVVVGLPDARLGARLEAAIVDDGAPADEAELRAHVEATLGARSAPARIRSVPALPALPGGKVDRRAVAELLGAARVEESAE